MIQLVSLNAQKVTRVKGSVLDASTLEPIPFASLSFLGTSIGETTDLSGKYRIETRFASDSLQASFLGYKSVVLPVKNTKRNTIDFLLEPEVTNLETVELVFKKEKYSKKNNPAVELMRKVLANKDRNRIEASDYYYYDQHEKVRIDVNNITEKFKNRRLMRPFELVWEYIDTSDINGKNYLPVYLRNILSTVYYKKAGDVKKEYRKAIESTNLDDNWDLTAINDILDVLYVDLDIYDEVLPLMEVQFLSPVSRKGIDFYRYYILDTIEQNGQKVIDLAFIPAVKGNTGFTGNLYISLDGRFAVTKASLGIANGINLNFVRDLQLTQEYSLRNDQYLKTLDDLTVDYTLTKNSIGFFGTRSMSYGNYRFEPPDDLSIYDGLENIVIAEDAYVKEKDYWTSDAIYRLDANDEGLDEMVSRLKKTFHYNVFMRVLRLSTTGFVSVGFLDIGPIVSLASFNDVVGLNLQLGGETNYKLSKKFRLRGYLAYARRTEQWKHQAALLYTFNKAFRTNPQHYIEFRSELESSFPGQGLEFFNPNNFLLSFQRGITTRMLLERKYDLRYVKEISSYGFILGLNKNTRTPYGSLEFSSLVAGDTINQDRISTTEIFAGIRIAPNEQFIQGQDRRVPIFNKYPVINLSYSLGVRGLLGGNYSYHRLQLDILKQVEWPRLGTTNLLLESGKTWGDIPYLLQFVVKGNQTYVYDFNAFNMMNFLEFVNDQFVSFKMEHFFQGYFFNRIPLVKHLKLREIIGFKMIYGSLSDDKNPNFNPGQIQYTENENGIPATFSFDNRPYVEASFGLSNLLKVLRLDLIKRFTYLDNPEIPTLFGVNGLAIRGSMLLEF